MHCLQPGRIYSIQRGFSNLRYLSTEKVKSTLRDPIMEENKTNTSVTESHHKDGDTPVKFSSNRQWHAAMNFKPSQHFESGTNWKGHSVTISLIIFMVYFCILREENDLDEGLFKPLEKTVDISRIEGTAYGRKKNVHPPVKD